MLKATQLAALSVIMSLGLRAQVLYNESFSGLSLLTYTGTSSTFQYNFLPANLTEIRDNYRNDTTEYNKPFNVYPFKREGWAIYQSTSPTTDTFLVATSWLDTAVATRVDRWIITPVINNIASNSVLSWNAMAPDAGNRDGYEVYITTNTTGTLTVNDFTSANKAFGLYDVDNGGLGEETSWTKHGVNLAGYAGQSIKVAFRANSKDKFQLWLDDIKVENVTTSLDLALTSVAYSKYVFTNNTTLITANIANSGASDISNVVLSYSVGVNFPVAQPFTFSPPLGPYAVSQVTFAIPFSLSAPGYNTVKVYVSGVNGVTDNLQTNDTLSGAVSGINYNNYKKVLLKKYVSAMEGWTPDAQQVSDFFTLDTNVVMMAVHQNDSMATSAGNAMISTYSASIPSGAVDNRFWTDLAGITIERNDWNSKIGLQESTAAPVKISVLNKNYNAGTRTLTFDVKLDFVTQLKGPYHLNTSLIENNVCGPFNDNTLNGWNQLSNVHNNPTSAYYLLGAYYNGASYILSPYDYKHRQVMIRALDGANGDNTLLPLTITNGQSFTKSYSYMLPPAFANGNIYNADNIYIVSYVEDFDADLTKRLVVNVAQSKLTSNTEAIPVSVQEQSKASAFSVYPNPASNYTEVLFKGGTQEAYTLTFSNQLGETLYSRQLSGQNEATGIDLSGYPAGMYIIALEGTHQKISRKLIITK